MAAITPFEVIDNPIHFNVAEDEADANISPRTVPFRIQEDNINSDLYPGALVLKDYNLLDNKPLINGVELEGGKTLAELGIAPAPLKGNISEITPAQAIAALQASRMVLLETTIPISGMSVPTVFVATLIAANMVGGTQIVAYVDGTNAVKALQLIGVSGGDWEFTETEMQRAAATPLPCDNIPEMDQGSGDEGDESTYARGDHIHPTDTTRFASASTTRTWSSALSFEVGDYVVFAGSLYRCKRKVTAPSSFHPEDWDEATLLSDRGYVEKAALSGAIPYAAVDDTSTSTAFTATVPGITEYKNGVCVMLRNGVVTSAAGFTININGLGGKPVYSSLAAASQSSTIFNVAYTMLFVYDEDRVEGGCWVVYYGYDSNTNTIGYQLRTNSTSLPMDSVTYRYRLLFKSLDGERFVPANNSTSTNATAKRNTIQTVIDPFGGIFYYGTTSSVAAGSRPSTSYLWEQYNITLGYSFNRTGAALVLTAYKPVYIKAAPQSGGGAIIDAEEPYVQALPTTNDGNIYIYLGVATAATTVEIVPEHPVYYHDGTRIRLYT